MIHRGYNTAAGFLFLLEPDRTPSIVKRLITAIRHCKYMTGSLRLTEQSLDNFWAGIRRGKRTKVMLRS